MIEEGERLSRSRLWRLQRSFFERRGMEAWSRGTVPHYITSNPYIAQAYARVVLGWLRDLAHGAGELGLDRAAPIHVVELGAGSGRFAFYVLRALQRLLDRSRLGALRVRYVMTDLAAATVDAWLSHASLAPFFEAGVLDVARFDVERDDALQLQYSGETLTGSATANPIAVIANYVLDSVPQDAFSIRDGVLHEARVTLRAPAGDGAALDLDDPALLARLTTSYAHVPVRGRTYDDPRLERTLRAVADWTTERTFLFPSVALACFGRLVALGGGRMLVLAGDKGFGDEGEVRRRDATFLDVHGSISFMVEFPALGRWFVDQGGVALRHAHPHGELCVSAFVLGAPADGPVETALAYEEAIGHQGPDDYFALRQRVRQHYLAMDLSELLAWLRFGEHDPTALLDAWNAIVSRLPTAGAAERDELRRAIHATWAAYFPIGEPRDLAFALAMLLGALGRHTEALTLFAHSIAQHGDDPRTHAQIAICLARMGRLDAALAAVERALAIEPLPDILALRDELRTKLAATAATAIAPA